MTKLKDYHQRYQRLHNNADPVMIGDKLVKGAHLFDGSNIKKMMPHFKQWHKETVGEKTMRVLDYGCGKAEYVWSPKILGKTLFELFPGKINSLYLYDPGNSEFCSPPPSGSMFDAVFCCDVMEHVPEEFVGVVLTEINRYVSWGGKAFFTISCNAAKKSFMDGENLHVTVKDTDWWKSQFDKFFERSATILLELDGSTKVIHRQ